MKILNVETVTEAGGVKENEDAFFSEGNRFGVFDGASSLDGYLNDDGKTGAYLASHIVRDAFAQTSASLSETADTANRQIQSAMLEKQIDVTRKESLWSTTMAAVEIDMENAESNWVQIADSLILYIYNDGTYKLLIEDDYNHDREVMGLWKEMADNGTENIREQLQEQVVLLRQTANSKYGVLNGEPEAVNFIRSGKESLKNVSHILLFTDGMMIPEEDPNAEEDFSKTVELFLEGGLTKVREYVREIENSDPECRKYPRYKKSDDLTAVAISFE
jgi:hypothetical protein